MTSQEIEILVNQFCNEDPGAPNQYMKPLQKLFQHAELASVHYKRLCNKVIEFITYEALEMSVRNRCITELAYFLHAILAASGKDNRSERQQVDLEVLVRVKELLVTYKELLDWKMASEGAEELVNVFYSLSLSEPPDFVEPYMGGVVEAITPQMKGRDRGSELAAMCIANLVGHKEGSAHLAAEAIPELVKVLNAAVTFKPYKNQDFSPKGVCTALANLSIADSNAKAMLDENVVPLFFAVIARRFDDYPERTKMYGRMYVMDARSIAAKAVWNMAFKTDLEAIQPDAKAILRKFLEDEDLSPQGKSNAQGALFQMARSKAQAKAHSKEQQKVTKSKEIERAAAEDDESSEEELADSSSGTGHIMLSYNWGSQDLVLKLNKDLKAAGYDVWVDVEQMKQSTLEAMAKAVEQASVVVVVMTSAYKESESCRTEGEYAYMLKKKIVPVKAQSNYRPDGWLGAMLGAKLYYDFSDNDSYSQKFAELKKELEEAMGKSSKGNAVKSSIKAKLTDAEARIRELETQLSQAQQPAAVTPVTTQSRRLAAAPAAASVANIEQRLDAIEAKIDAMSEKLSTQGCCTVS